MSRSAPALPDVGLGFRSVEREHDGVALPVEGTVPDWLSGRLLRNGPGRFEVGGERVAHWFDGLAMLTSFAFEDGSVAYANRFLRSREYRSVLERGRLAGDQFGTANGGFLGRIRDRLLPTVTDNANVNVMRVGGRHVAVTETQVGVEFDPVTLETLGRYAFDDLDGQTMCAHPVVDPDDGETVTLATEFGRRSRYRLYRSPAGSERFLPVGAVETPRPAYVHSFGLTADHVVVVEFPYDVHPLRLLVPDGDAFIDRFRWRPERGTRFVVVDRGTGEVVAEHTGDPVFGFHHVNAFEADGAAVVDVAVFESPAVIDALRMDALASGTSPPVDGALVRYRLPLDGGSLGTETLHDDAVTLPRIDPARLTRPYRSVYAQGPPDPGAGVPPRLLRVDVDARSAVEWAEPGTYCGEPVFVPRPGAEHQDDGVVLSVVLETEEERSSLLLLDGRTLEEVGRAPLPHVVPFDFHGQFYPREALA